MEDVELISVSLRPCYLPREFEHIFMTVVHAPVFDQASAVRAGKTIAATVHVLQLLSVDAPCFIVGNFNHCDLSKTLPSFKQYVTLYSQWRMGQFIVMTGSNSSRPDLALQCTQCVSPFWGWMKLRSSCLHYKVDPHRLTPRSQALRNGVTHLWPINPFTAPHRI